MKTLKQLITESVNEYLREIEEAGNNEAIERKMAKCEEAIALRERKINKEGIEEAMHDMIDPKKIKELQKEVKVIEKTLKKYQKQLEKLKSKNKHVGAEDTEDSTEEKEEIIDENMEDMEYNMGMKDNMGMNDDEERYDADGNQTDDGSYDADRNLVDPEREIERAEYNRVDESFLYMQKLAGLITEGQYQAKKKVLNRKKSIAEGMDENLVVTYIKNKADYPEKGLADGFHEYEGKTVKYIVGYDENDEYDEIGYIYAKNNDIKSYSDDELDNAFMISLAEGQYQAKKKSFK
jgi:hypothetical protein